MSYNSVAANVPYKPTAHKLLQAITTAEELTCDPPKVLIGVADTPQEGLPDRSTDKDIVFAAAQNTGSVDVYYTFDSTPPDADNHHGLLAPYQQVDLSKVRQSVTFNGPSGAWKIAINQFRRAANL